MLCRERRSWTAEEDQLLRDAVEREDPGTMNPSKWHAIAKHVPDRTNKDCRKRWFAKMASDVVKGGWSPEEDERLVQGIEKYGTRWSMVAAFVQSRNSDQCAKRWTDTLNPTIDRTTWSPEADALLINAVKEHGKLWTKIVRSYFPGRTGLSAKNRYNSITRFNNDSRARRPSYRARRKSGSVSSSSPSVSSASSSPVTPSAQIPELSGEHSYPSSSAVASDPSLWLTPTFMESDSDRLPLENLSYDEIFSALLPPPKEALDGIFNQDSSAFPLESPSPYDTSFSDIACFQEAQTHFMTHANSIFSDPVSQNIYSELFQQSMHPVVPTPSIHDTMPGVSLLDPQSLSAFNTLYAPMNAQFWSGIDINQPPHWLTTQ